MSPADAWARLRFLLDWQEPGDPDFYQGHLDMICALDPEAAQLERETEIGDEPVCVCATMTADGPRCPVHPLAVVARGRRRLYRGRRRAA